MTQFYLKAGLLAVVATLSACSCLKSPDLDVAGDAGSSKYGKGGAGMAGKMPNSADVKSKFESEFVAGGFNTVYFDYDSAAITGAGEGNLQKFATFAKANDVKGVTVEGHADERGTREYNFALGARRAESAKNYLIARGVGANRIRTTSYGKERPVAVCNDISCWSQNRRVQTVLAGGTGS
jgi:peptidoglycan-associated lipoprotein